MQNISDQVLGGKSISLQQAQQILRAKGSELSFVLAGAHRIKEKFFGNKVELCSIINAKSGRCAENCAFCAQSAHAKTDAPVYPLKTKAEILQGARQAEIEGSHC